MIKLIVTGMSNIMWLVDLGLQLRALDNDTRLRSDGRSNVTRVPPWKTSEIVGNQPDIGPDNIRGYMII